jgi:hypothetical protein
MTIDTLFDDLQKLLRGSRCSALLLNARTQLDEGDLSEALAEMNRVRETYETSRKSTLSKDVDEMDPASKESHRIKRRQNKASDALEIMSDLITQITSKQSKRLKTTRHLRSLRLPLQSLYRQIKLQPIAHNQQLIHLIRRACCDMRSQTFRPNRMFGRF